MRYAAVGLFLNVALYALYVALTTLWLPPLPAMTASYAAGVMLGFFMNRRITFGHDGRPAGPLLRYAVAYAAGYLVNLVGLWWLVNVMMVPHQAAQAALVVSIAFLLFVIQRHWVFAEPRRGAARSMETVP